MAVRKGTALALALLGLAFAAPAAQASFHLMKIREIGQGGGGVPDYVELQMYAAGQNLVGSNNAKIQSYDDTGAVLSTFTFPSDVANAANQRTIYVARDDAAPLGVPDFVSPNLVLPNNGAVCFGQTFGAGQAIDCVSYGTFAGFQGGVIPSPVGTAAPAPASGQAITRSIAAGCPTLLEDSDDSNNSASDFALGSQNPRNNAAVPTETACSGGGGGGGTINRPQTTITDGPKKKSTKRRVKISFESTEPRSSFKCKLDKRDFEACDSPFKARVKPGKHRFTVFAIDADGNEDQSPAEIKFKVKRKRH
jgi:hypothetical protein